jgi:hypothetical protein
MRRSCTRLPVSSSCAVIVLKNVAIAVVVPRLRDVAVIVSPNKVMDCCQTRDNLRICFQVVGIPFAYYLETSFHDAEYPLDDVPCRGMAQVVQFVSGLRLHVTLCPFPKVIAYAAIWEQQAGGRCKFGISKIKLAVGYLEPGIVDGL